MKILLVGAGGYGTVYVKALLNSPRADVTFEGIVDPYITSSAEYENITAAGIPVYNTMDEFYREHTAELAVISTPPFLHCEQSITALRNGSYVLCEKPVAPTLDDVQKMLDAEKEFGKFIAIGYQWAFSDAILSLKKDILSGVLGAPVSMKAAISVPRTLDYYKRGGGWGGKIAKDGITVLDSVASNACAHYLFNMLFVLGDTMDQSAFADQIEADCLRANDIETFDTCSIRARAADVPIYFIASHATEKISKPEFVYTFEKATVRYTQSEDSLIHATFENGEKKCYGNPFANERKKLWECVDAISSGNVPVCTVKTAMAQTALIEDLHKTTEYRTFDKESIALTESGDRLYVKGLFDKLYQAYEKELLLSEL